MNREIKFRAWDKKNNKWVDHNQHLNDTNVSASVNPPSILGINHPDWDFQQFTGLKDKNGKEIYEGDILRIQSNYETDEPVDSNAQVFFRDGSFRTDFHDAILNIALPGKWLFEIIGNIWENPELLK